MQMIKRQSSQQSSDPAHRGRVAQASLDRAIAAASMIAETGAGGWELLGQSCLTVATKSAPMTAEMQGRIHESSQPRSSPPAGG